jgi:hypothetical protein
MSLSINQLICCTFLTGGQLLPTSIRRAFFKKNGTAANGANWELTKTAASKLL